MLKFYFSSLLFAFAFCLNAQSGCPGCLVNLPASLPEDTIYLSSAADGQVGVYYDSGLSFRMPKTTTPVNASDPGTPPGLAINQITITSVSNLPPGLSWEASQTTFDVSEETDGCVKFCGVPLIPGFYNVEVVVSAEVLFISQVSSFSFPIMILPGTSVTEGFTLANNSGCGSVEASFTNNVPSGGNDGYSYFWDFGNGNMSTGENPVSQVYDEAGVYAVNYQAVIDTFGFLLTEVVVESVECNDLFNNAPDLRIEIWDPDGERIFETMEVENAQTPVNFIVNLFIGEGNYLLRVMDEDSGIQGGDDECGAINFNRLSNGGFTNGGLQARLNIFHPVDTIQSVDTVRVYEQPAPPQLEGDGPGSLCSGDIYLLSVTNGYDSGLQWYQDSLPLIGIDSPELSASASGDYWVTYTNPDGCSATSAVQGLTFNPLPDPPIFQNFNNLLTLYDPEGLPETYGLQWYRNDILIEGANEMSYCMETSGSYRLEVVDLLTGCRSSYELQATYDPAFPGCVATGVKNERPLALIAYPNPTNGLLFLEGKAENGEVQATLYNSQGQILHSLQNPTAGPAFRESLDISHYPSGVYILEVRSGQSIAHLRVVKR